MEYLQNQKVVIVLAALLSTISLFGCAAKNDYNLPISLGLIVLATRQKNIDLFKITYLLLGGSTLIDIVFLYHFWGTKSLTPKLHIYSLVITTLEIMTKISLVGALTYGIWKRRVINSTIIEQNISPV